MPRGVKRERREEVGSRKDVGAILEERGRWKNPRARQVGRENGIDSTQESKVVGKQGPSLERSFPSGSVKDMDNFK